MTKEENSNNPCGNFLSLLNLTYFIFSMVAFGNINNILINNDIYSWLHNNSIFMLSLMSFNVFFFIIIICLFCSLKSDDQIWSSLVFLIIFNVVVTELSYMSFGTWQIYSGTSVITDFGPNCINTSYVMTNEGLYNCNMFNTYLKPLYYLLIITVSISYLCFLMFLCTLPLLISN